MPYEIRNMSTEFMGAVQTRFAEMEVDYRQGGIDIGADIFGLNYFLNYDFEVADGSAVVPRYDEEEQTLYIYEPEASGGEDTSAEAEFDEISSNRKINLRVTAMGK